MNADELDDLARRLAAAPMSRRTTLKTVAAAAIMAPFLDIARHRPEGNARPRARPLAASPVCDWSSAGSPCVLALGGTILTAAACAAVESGITAVKCVTGLVGTPAAWKACGRALNCQCPAGSVVCEDKYTDTDCCESGEVCVKVFGCVTPCDSCSQRDIFGECQSSCTGSQVCCNGSCVDTQTDPNNCGACGNACGTGAYCCTTTDGTSGCCANGAYCVNCNGFGCVDPATTGCGSDAVCCDNSVLYCPESEQCCPGTNYHVCALNGYCCPTLCSVNPC